MMFKKYGANINKKYEKINSTLNLVKLKLRHRQVGSLLCVKNLHLEL